MNPHCHGLSTSLIAMAWLASSVLADDTPKGDRPPLEMSKAVVCKKVEGYEKFVPLPDASMTSEDKLNVYFRPLNFRVDAMERPRPGQRFRARFVEDCRIRRKGEKAVLQKKDKLLEFDPVFELRDERLYILNNISLKGLSPGDYELDVVLHDALEEGVTATQTVAFTVIPTPKVDQPDAKDKDEGAGEPDGPPAPAKEARKKVKTTRTIP